MFGAYCNTAKQMLTFYISRPLFECNAKLRCISTRLQLINVHFKGAHTFILIMHGRYVNICKFGSRQYISLLKFNKDVNGIELHYFFHQWVYCNTYTHVL